MKKAILFLLFTFLSLQGQESSIAASKINFIPIANKNFVGHDSYGYNYFLDKAVFSKSKNKEQWEYKNVSLGNLTKIDLTNPLKIVLFYQDFNAVILLDNQLSETQRILFFESENPINLRATGMAGLNQLWTYNTLDQQIGLYNYLNNTYKTISTPFPDTIQYYQTDFNHFYWIDDKNMAFMCNLFGKITNLYKIPEYEWIEFLGEQQILYSKDHLFYMQDYSKNKVYKIELVDKTFDKCYYKDQILSTFTNEGITNYKIIIP
ncbi:hypothetical protein FFWV33_06710 [Flavobacterium faecale]|uniref:Uncharacterized protein n=1 Tax=Flavobacterium faecale TaxID=1355330 RepID=A0A2S1LBW2_9FLAO|nr:hypothetical protein [Flavobacterium faecale]AWG21245.1 hypothetical protein FFWV33_06710 [Flavobacterium faecale]